MASDRGHHNRNVNVRAIGIVGIGLTLLAAGSIFMLNALFRHFETRENVNQAGAIASQIEPRKVPAEPGLQDHAVQDLQLMRAEEDRILNSYAWVDKKKRIVRIPIERAIDLLANRGLRGPAKHSTPNRFGDAASAGPPAASNVLQRLEPVAHPLATTQAKEGYTK